MSAMPGTGERLERSNGKLPFGSLVSMWPLKAYTQKSPPSRQFRGSLQHAAERLRHRWR